MGGFALWFRVKEARDKRDRRSEHSLVPALWSTKRNCSWRLRHGRSFTQFFRFYGSFPPRTPALITLHIELTFILFYALDLSFVSVVATAFAIGYIQEIVYNKFGDSVYPRAARPGQGLQR
jgi:hypothetical protein